jgi:hypothetical protein
MLCIERLLRSVRYAHLSDRMKVENAVSRCEDIFWEKVIDRSGAAGASYKDVVGLPPRN